MNRPITFAVLALAAAGFMAGCSTNSGATDTADASAPAPQASAAAPTAPATRTATAVSRTAVASATSSGNATDHYDAADEQWDEGDVVEVELRGNTAEGGDGVAVTGSTVIITKAGAYRLSGELRGSLVVDAGDDDLVQVILDGVTISNDSGAALVVLEAGTAVVILVDGSENRLSDGADYAFPNAETDEPNAALFSASDLTIAGSGSLIVEGNFNDGIASKDGLVISSGAIDVKAADDGIRGKDYLVVRGGLVTVTARGDGLKADNGEDAALGYVAVLAGTLTVTSGGDGIDAATDAIVTNGTLKLAAGGGSGAKIAADLSAKGIKGDVGVVIEGGEITIDSADDALHSNVAVTVANGKLVIATGDDAIHGDATLTIDGGEITITRSYEGLESSAIVINAGTISLVSSDDGLNAAGGVDGSGVQPGARPADRFAAGNHSITINGGTVLVNSGGDGVDANGSVTMTGGTVVVQGPSANGNGAIDYDGTFTISGGTIVAAGSGGMAQAPGAASSQASILYRFGSAQPAGTVVSIRTADGTELVAFKAAKGFQAFVLSSPAVAKGGTYTVFSGAASSGISLGGLLQGGESSGGTQVGTVVAGAAATAGR